MPRPRNTSNPQDVFDWIDEISNDKQDVATLAEAVRDTVGTTLVAGNGTRVTVDDPGNTLTIAGWLGPGIVSGRYFGPTSHGPGASVGTTALPSANIHVAVPFLCPNDMTVDRIGVYVTIVAPGGQTCRLGIYNAGADFLPSTLLVDGGTVAIDALGIREATINQALVGGTWYFAVLAHTDESGTVTFSAASPAVSMLGLTGVGSSAALSIPMGFVGITRANTTFVSPFGTPTLFVSTYPAFALRAV